MSGHDSRRDARARPLISSGLRLDRPLYAILLCAFAGIAVSGVVWTLVADVLALDIEGLSHTLAQIHGGFAIPATGIVGVLLAQHARIGWRARRNRLSGAVAVSLALLLGGTAWGLYYGSEEWHATLVWSHIVLGLTALFLVPLHVWLGRRTSGSSRGS